MKVKQYLLIPILFLFAQLPVYAQTGGSEICRITEADLVAAGSIASVFGVNLASGTAANDGSIPLPTTLAGSSFQIGGRAAPLFSASPLQVNLQIP